MKMLNQKIFKTQTINFKKIFNKWNMKLTIIFKKTKFLQKLMIKDKKSNKLNKNYKKIKKCIVNYVI